MGQRWRQVSWLGVAALEFSVAALMGVMVLVVLWGVASRFVLGDPSQWTNDAATSLLVWLTFLAAAAAFRRWEHLGLDWLAEKLAPEARRLVEVLASLVCALFAAVALVGGGGELVLDTFASGQMMTTLPLLKGWEYLAVPLGGVLICVFSLQRAWRLWAGADGRPTADSPTEA